MKNHTSNRNWHYFCELRIDLKQKLLVIKGILVKQFNGYFFFLKNKPISAIQTKTNASVNIKATIQS